MSASAAAIARQRDVQIVSLVGLAHILSHFYQLTLAPLFPLIYAEQGYSYTQLGLLVTLFYVASGVLQPLAGFLVDHIGPKRVLYVGVALMAGATSLYGFAPNYGVLILLSVIAGAGNAVFHPSDYTILSLKVSESRIGRGFGLHSFAGYVGYAAAPLTMAWLGSLMGWQQATLLVGVLGIVILGVLITFGHELLEVTPEPKPSGEPKPPFLTQLRPLRSVAVVACFTFFMLTAMAQAGLQTFSASALNTMYDLPLLTSNGAITWFLVAACTGILAGGVLADRSQRHEAVAMYCLVIPVMLCFVPAFVVMSSPLIFFVYAGIGFGFGLLIPSRDMLIRATAPRNASGKVFGFVYAGLDVGSGTTPVCIGWMLDHGHPQWMFFTLAACLTLAMFTIRYSVTAPK